MFTLKKFPWVSLLLVLLSYSTLGWVISETKPDTFVWFGTGFAILLFICCLTNPWWKLTDFTSTFFKSSARTFLFAIVLAFVFFLIIAWYQVFLDTLLVVSASILARIDMQTNRLHVGKSFWLMSVVSLVGLALGAIIQMLFVG